MKWKLMFEIMFIDLEKRIKYFMSYSLMSEEIDIDIVYIYYDLGIRAENYLIIIMDSSDVTLL